MCMSEVGSRKVRIVVNGETGHLVSNRRRLICLIAKFMVAAIVALTQESKMIISSTCGEARFGNDHFELYAVEDRGIIDGANGNYVQGADKRTVPMTSYVFD